MRIKPSWALLPFNMLAFGLFAWVLLSTREPPWAMLAVSCCLLLALGGLWWNHRHQIDRRPQEQWLIRIEFVVVIAAILLGVRDLILR